MELDSVRRLKAEIDEKQERLKLLKTSAIRIPTLDGLPRAKATESPTEKLATAIAELEADLIALAEEFDAAAAELLKTVIFKVGGIHGRILALRYVCCLPMKEVVAEIGLSEARVYALRQEAVNKFNSAR